jgi:hypothetical protein
VLCCLSLGCSEESVVLLQFISFGGQACTGCCCRSQGFTTCKPLMVYHNEAAGGHAGMGMLPSSPFSDANLSIWHSAWQGPSASLHLRPCDAWVRALASDAVASPTMPQLSSCCATWHAVLQNDLKFVRGQGLKDTTSRGGFNWGSHAETWVGGMKSVCTNECWPDEAGLRPIGPHAGTRVGAWHGDDVWELRLSCPAVFQQTVMQPVGAQA